MDVHQPECIRVLLNSKAEVLYGKVGVVYELEIKLKQAVLDGDCLIRIELQNPYNIKFPCC